MILREDFRDTEDLDGLFSGYDPETGTYDVETWQYEGDDVGRRRPGDATTETAMPRARARPDRRLRRRADRRATRTATTRCRTRAACSRCSRHFARYTPEMVRGGLRHPRGDVPRGRRRADPQLRPGAHERVLLRGGLDPPHRRRAVHPRRVDPAGAAGQHRPPGRRDPGAARARQHPGLHRHPDAVRPAARLHPDAARAPRAGPARRSSRPTPATRASGATWTPTSSACSRPGSATPPPPENDFCFDHLPRLDGDHSSFHDGDGPGRAARCRATS